MVASNFRLVWWDAPYEKALDGVNALRPHVGRLYVDKTNVNGNSMSNK